MRGKAAVGACVGLALLAGGCDPLERMYLREGVGVNLYDAEALDVAQLQDAYLGVMCRQAGLPSGFSGEVPVCSIPATGSPEWMLIVQAGMNDIDRRCDGWLTWLDNKSRWTGPIHQQIINTQIATQAILGYTLADPVTAINIVGAAFGFASNSFTAFNNRLLFQLEKSTVQGLVLQRQQDFRNMLPRIVNNRPAAIYALRQYLRLCMPITIETQVNTTVKIFESAGPEGLRQSRPMIDATSVNSAVRSAVIPGAGAPISRPQKTTIIRDDVRIGVFEQQMLPSVIKDFQRVVCLNPDGKLTTAARSAILSWLRNNNVKDANFPDRITERDASRLRNALDDGPRC